MDKIAIKVFCPECEKEMIIVYHKSCGVPNRPVCPKCNKEVLVNRSDIYM